CRTSKAVTVEHSACVFFDKFAHGDSHRQFPGTGSFYFPRNTEHFCSRVLCEAEFLKPLGAVVDDVWNVAKGFHIVDDSWSPKESADLREGRFGSWRGAFTLQ